MSKFLALLQRDVRGIYRDGFLVMMTAYNLLIAVAARIVLRWVPIENIEVYVAPFIIITACSLVGLVFGFALVEERETQTWLLMRVIPISQRTLAAYWLVAVGGFCFVIALLSALIYGLAPASVAGVLVFAAVTAVGAPVVMLLLGALASNKIEGMAVGKIISGSSLLLVPVFVLPSEWHVAVMWYPWYWLYLGLLRVYAGPELAPVLAVRWPPVPLWAQAVIPLVLSLFALVFLTRRYRRTQ